MARRWRCEETSRAAMMTRCWTRRACGLRRRCALRAGVQQTLALFVPTRPRSSCSAVPSHPSTPDPRGTSVYSAEKPAMRLQHAPCSARPSTKRTGSVLHLVGFSNEPWGFRTRARSASFRSMPHALPAKPGPPDISRLESVRPLLEAARWVKRVARAVSPRYLSPICRRRRRRRSVFSPQLPRYRTRAVPPAWGAHTIRVCPGPW
mmetsp:Transcript_24444/g.55739  ORF Transcript_24444/g.55739 Transcript_24444/m.55739 type:complete len:206 (-) Transcript_24444:19-636(-)